jgi:hypothetical protein
MMRVLIPCPVRHWLCRTMYQAVDTQTLPPGLSLLERCWEGNRSGEGERVGARKGLGLVGIDGGGGWEATQYLHGLCTSHAPEFRQWGRVGSWGEGKVLPLCAQLL